MKTLKKIIYSVWEQIENFNITDDSPYVEKWFADLAVSVNQSLLREAFDNLKLSESLFLFEENLPVKKFEESIVIDGIPIGTDKDYCYVELNPLIEQIGFSNIKFFGDIDLQKNFSRKNIKQFVNNDKGAIYKLDHPKYVVLSDKALIKGPNLPSVVSVLGLWRDPREASSYTDDMAFPTPSEHKLELLMVQQVHSTQGRPWDMAQDGQRAIGQVQEEKNKE